MFVQRLSFADSSLILRLSYTMKPLWSHYEATIGLFRLHLFYAIMFKLWLFMVCVCLVLKAENGTMSRGVSGLVVKV